MRFKASLTSKRYPYNPIVSGCLVNSKIKLGGIEAQYHLPRRAYYVGVDRPKAR